jgi:hypothetical protein
LLDNYEIYPFANPTGVPNKALFILLLMYVSKHFTHGIKKCHSYYRKGTAIYLEWHWTPCLHYYWIPFGNLWASKSTIVNATYWHYEEIKIDSSWHDYVLKGFRILMNYRLFLQTGRRMRDACVDLSVFITQKNYFLSFSSFSAIERENLWFP